MNINQYKPDGNNPGMKKKMSERGKGSLVREIVIFEAEERKVK